MKCLFESVKREHRNTGGCSRGDCVFAPQDNAESPSHSLQQLKAEIAALADNLQICIGKNAYNEAYVFVNRLRQLSAV